MMLMTRKRLIKHGVFMKNEIDSPCYGLKKDKLPFIRGDRFGRTDACFASPCVRAPVFTQEKIFASASERAMC